MKKPLITHNGLLDILHLYNSFIGPLQETADDFKKDFIVNFPEVYDTKYIMNSSNVLLPEEKTSTSLADCFKYLENSELKIALADEFSDYDIKSEGVTVDSDPESNPRSTTSAAHEAGYDALMTGSIFVRSLKKLNILEELGQKNSPKKLKTYLNRLPLGGIKTPFNLSSNLDYYSAPSEEIFHCYCITKGDHKLAEILKIVSSYAGDISESIVYGDTIEFFFNVVKEEQMKELRNKLDPLGGALVCKFHNTNFQHLHLLLLTLRHRFSDRNPALCSNVSSLLAISLETRKRPKLPAK